MALAYLKATMYTIARRRTYIPAMQIVRFGTPARIKRATEQEEEKTSAPVVPITIIFYYNICYYGSRYNITLTRTRFKVAQLQVGWGGKRDFGR